MRKLALLPLSASLVAAPAAAAQLPRAGDVKQAIAVRVPADAIRVDGRLDEAVWARAEPIRDFVQKEPIEGVPPTERTEVRFVYDDDALYVGARMHSSAGRSAIQAPMGPRDSGGGVPGRRGQAEYILVSLDTFLDHRTAYSFGVTASGVRLDHYHRSDSETSVDPEFDPVWEARVTIDDEGWTAEMWIPWSQLRFNPRPEQVWGLNVHRWIPSKNEDDYWVAVPRTEEAWASRFGELRGIRAIRLARRLELLPYVAGGSAVNGDRDPADPFDDGLNLEGQTGVDLKMGLGPNLTLDATITPDFGQVEADPAVINLTANEVFFQERRPFFTEGSGLLSGPANNYFYSRRIGAPPPGSASGDYVDVPRSTTILGAAKLTGRLPSGTSVGVLGAVTGDEHARTFDLATGAFDRVRVAPRTLWGVARVQQEFGAAGSTAGLMATAVHRDLEPGEPLAALLTRNAATVAGDVLWRLAGGTYEIGLSGGVSYLDGDPEAILRVQRASQRYFQRPDATHVGLDPDRTTMAGAKATLTADKISGAHWLWSFYLDLESPEVEFNDIGRLTAGDGILTRQGITYRETRPGRLFRSYRFTANHSSEWNFAGERQYTRLNGSTVLTWNNFWTTSASAEISLRGQDQRLTRGGPSMRVPRSWTSSVDLRNSSSERTRWSAGIRYGQDELGGWGGRVDGEVSAVPAPRWQVSLGPSFEREVNPRQYVTTRTGGSPATYGGRYIFAFIDRTTLALEARLNFTLKPDLNLSLYAQPFAASGRYHDFGELSAARSRSLRTYGTDGTTIERQADGSYEVVDGADRFVLADRDFNVRSFRSTAVLQWEWRPGSTLYLVWQQDRSGAGPVGDRAGLDDLFGSFTASGDNFFAIKASYWFGR